LIEALSPSEYGMDGLRTSDEAAAWDDAAERASRREPSARDMTVQDLLRHTSGLTYGFFPNPAVDRMYGQAEVLGAKSLQDMVERLGRLPLKHQPGSTWEYSVSTDVLGRLVEVLSGRRFDQFLQERILGPLGMPDTAFYVSKDKVERFAQLYAATPEGSINVADPSVSERFVKEPTFLSGGGGMVSTTSDYVRFCQMMLHGGELDGVRLLSRKTVELMTRNHLDDVPRGWGSRGYGFGLGFAVAIDHTRSGLAGSEGEYYWGGMAGTGFWIDPKEEMIGIYMVQVFPSTAVAYREQFKQLAYQTVAD
jgi:CubicO group peptidase (beta-lactamase class C family)